MNGAGYKQWPNLTYFSCCRFKQDNDPKHTSKIVGKWLNWWKTHPESPDLNLMENLWHEQQEVKPTTKNLLINNVSRELLTNRNTKNILDIYGTSKSN